jgi:hypothetical protein
VTDGWAGCRGIGNPGTGYTRLIVNHSENFVDPETGVHTNTIEGTWNGIKQGVAARKRTRQLLNEKLIEFIWRRKHCANLWDGLIMAMRLSHSG